MSKRKKLGIAPSPAVAPAVGPAKNIGTICSTAASATVEAEPVSRSSEPRNRSW